MRKTCDGCGETFKDERLRVQLNDVFQRDFLKALKEMIEQSPEVKSCKSNAGPQFVQTHIWLYQRYNGKVLIEYLLERPRYERLLKQFDNDSEAVKAHYVECIKQKLATTLKGKV